MRTYEILYQLNTLPRKDRIYKIKARSAEDAIKMAEINLSRLYSSVEIKEINAKLSLIKR